MFRTVCILTAMVCAVLFVIFLIVPGSYIAGYGVSADTGGAFLGRRASPLFLGLGIVVWMLRHHEDHTVQRAISLGMIAIFAGIAATGLWAFFDGTASSTILLAAVGECVIAAAFYACLRRA